MPDLIVNFIFSLCNFSDLFKKMSAAVPAVFDNPQWEAARKALEAVSPQKKKSDVSNVDQGSTIQNQESPMQSDPPVNGKELSAQELYNQNFALYKQRPAMFPNRP